MTGGPATEINSIADLYREFHRPVFRYLYRLSGSAQIAEELTQETFFQSLMSLHRFRGDSRVNTWLFRIARNVYLNDRRAQAREEKIRRKMANEAQKVALTGNQPEKVLEQKMEGEKVLQVLQKLPEQYRTIILLKEVENLSHQELAVILGKSTASTKVMLFRAKQRFQEEYLKSEGGDHEPM